MRWLAALTDLVLAPVCLGCAGLVGAGDAARLVCRRCRSLLRPLPPPTCPRCGAPRLRTGRDGAGSCSLCEEWPAVLRSARSACLLHPPADALVHQLKYRGWRALAGPLAERMVATRLPDDVDAEARICVPVPTTTLRARHRGYNQAELLALAFASRTGREVRRFLARADGARSQTALQPVARKANVAGAFRVPSGHASAALRDAHLLLVDDVLTTGATATECARTLQAAGARCVSLITFARALDARRLST